MSSGGLGFRAEGARARHAGRMRAERRFVWYGRLALGLAVSVLVGLLGSIGVKAWSGFFQAEIRLAVFFDPALLEESASSGYQRAAQGALRREFPDVSGRADIRDLQGILGVNAGDVLQLAMARNPQLLAQTRELWLPVTGSELSDVQAQWLDVLKAKGALRHVFNQAFFTRGDSRTPEQAGFLGGIVGSLLTMLVCLSLAFPMGVMTAVYLEEFARPGKFVDLVEVNLNNLAAVPSIVFGLLGLAVYIGVIGLPRSAPIVGGLTLALMVLPVIIIATRSALKSVPPSIRHAAMALGASPVQVVWHHVLPLALPGVMTGTILGAARAIGETAPLLMIGMVAFVADIPTGMTSPATVMPVQIYLWASSPEAGFASKTAAGIMVLLALLLAMNALAIYIRKRFEVRW